MCIWAHVHLNRNFKNNIPSQEVLQKRCVGKNGNLEQLVRFWQAAFFSWMQLEIAMAKTFWSKLLLSGISLPSTCSVPPKTPEQTWTSGDGKHLWRWKEGPDTPFALYQLDAIWEGKQVCLLFHEASRNLWSNWQRQGQVKNKDKSNCRVSSPPHPPHYSSGSFSILFFHVSLAVTRDT